MRPRGDRASLEAGLAPAAVVVTGAFAALCFPTGMAVRIKTRSPQTMGVESPAPGILTFHFMWSVSLQVKGGSASGASPVASGPRHWGQNSLASDAELADAPSWSDSSKRTQLERVISLIG